MVAGEIRAGDDAFALRSMEDRDLEAVVAVEAEWAPTPWSQSTFSNELRVPFSRASVLHVAHEPRSVVGYMIRWLVADEMHLLSLAVCRGQRGRGLGGALLDSLCSEARCEKMELVTLEVEAGNAVARGLYASRGFRESRRRVNYYGTGRDALVMDWRTGCCAVS